MPNIHDVARRAGVSPVTVSRVVNGAPNVHSDTRARVELAIRELGYLPNLAARSLRARQTRTLALIVPDITNAFWTTVARGVEDAAQSGGYSVLLCNTDENPDKQRPISKPCCASGSMGLSWRRATPTWRGWRACPSRTRRRCWWTGACPAGRATRWA